MLQKILLSLILTLLPSCTQVKRSRGNRSRNKYVMLARLRKLNDRIARMGPHVEAAKQRGVQLAADGFDRTSANEEQTEIQQSKRTRVATGRAKKGLLTEERRGEESKQCNPVLPMRATNKLNLTYFGLKDGKARFGGQPVKLTLGDELKARGKQVAVDAKGTPTAKADELLLALALCVPGMTKDAWLTAREDKTDVILPTLAARNGYTEKWDTRKKPN